MENKKYKIKLILQIIFISLILIFLLKIGAASSAYGEIIKKENYEISRSKVEREIQYGNIFRDSVKIKNLKSQEVKISLFPIDEISEIIEIETPGNIIKPNEEAEIFFRVMGKEVKTYLGYISISGEINDRIEINISVVNKTLDPEFFLKIEPLQHKFSLNNEIEVKIKIEKLTKDELKNFTFIYNLISEDNATYNLGSEQKDFIGSTEITKKFEIPAEAKEGIYILEIVGDYKDLIIIDKVELELNTPFWNIRLFGFLPAWLAFIIASVILSSIAAFIIIRKKIEKRKKYKMQLFTKTLPKKDERSLWLGKIAETTTDAYLEMDALTTHCVVAGATGGGKSIAAQVIIEEVIKKGAAIIVFDPTAQWSGMLRKCDDKKMLSFYQKFGLKPGDAQAFPGNVRQILNERQSIDIMKHMTPGHIQIFTMNKLTPTQIDNFVASIIAEIFKTGPDEHPGLRLMLVFDEVHRLLPKFGGSGKGFLQIERACREFRKWGFGVMLVSQVLSDFVGEIKANINTEVQMRTRDESDLNRLKTKYGEEFLQSLIKASVGVGMFVNPKYNKGKPYFINFRPILHNTRRLTDAVLEQYNKYGELIDDLEYQIEQLEQEKIDTFDLKMELKLVKDKLMTGNFTVVDIYLEGLKPRIEKQWDSIGKKPKKREIELIKTEDIEASIKEAQKGRQEFEKTQEKETQNAEEKKEDISKKIVAPFTFENGMMISSLKELKESIPSIDNEIFAEHVNENKNEIADWVKKEINPELGEKLKAAKKKEEFIKIVSDFEKAASKKDEKQKEDKKENKDKESGKQASNDKK